MLGILQGGILSIMYFENGGGKMNVIKLDHINNIEVDLDKIPLGNPRALLYMPKGLYSLAYPIREKEIGMLKNKFGIVFMGLGFYEDSDIMACQFHWFSTSLYNFVRLIALIDYMTKKSCYIKDLTTGEHRDNVNKYCSEYTKEVIPEIYVWRNKVAAHFAITGPRKEDNEATLEVSLMEQITYEKPYFKAGSLVLVKNGVESKVPSWSLTKVYEDICERYWPHVKLKPLTDSNKTETKEPLGGHS
jgi:hypothetical protein